MDEVSGVRCQKKREIRKRLYSVDVEAARGSFLSFEL